MSRRTLPSSALTMDSAVLKTALDSQNQAYRDALEIFMGQVENKVQALQATVSDLTRSLEFTQKDVEDLNIKMNQQQRELRDKDQLILDLSEKLKASEVHFKDLYERCNYQEDYNRRNNLQFIGIGERQGGETWEQSAAAVSKVLEDHLQLPNLVLERAHRVGQLGDNRPRPIVARFARYCDREAVLRNVRKLKGTKIFVNEDLCPASHNIRKSQLPALKQARSEGKVAYFRHTKLIIREKPASERTEGAPRRGRSLGLFMSGTSPSASGTDLAGGTTSTAAASPLRSQSASSARDGSPVAVAAAARDLPAGSGAGGKGKVQNQRSTDSGGSVL